MPRRPRQQNTAAIAPRFLTLPDASIYTGYSSRTLREFITNGRLKSYRATENGDLRVTIEDLNALLGA